jgi:hypothetical protein
MPGGDLCLPLFSCTKYKVGRKLSSLFETRLVVLHVQVNGPYKYSFFLTWFSVGKIIFYSGVGFNLKLKPYNMTNLS